MHKILVLGHLAPPYDQYVAVAKNIELIHEPGVLTADEFIIRVKMDSMIQGVICCLGQSITQEILEALPQLRVISNIAVGLNNINLEVAQRLGIKVAHTPHVLTSATADLAWALLLGGARHLVKGDRLARSGQWAGWKMDQLLGQPVGSYLSYDRCEKYVSRQIPRTLRKTIGIIGLGEIGQAIARRACGFEMDVVYFNRTRKPDLETLLEYQYMDLDELLKIADYVVLALALTPDTVHTLNHNRLQLMRPNAFIVNIGRGALIDELALIKVLEEGHLSGAALDVYEREPLIPDRLRALNNVTLSPHLGSATLETRQAMSHLAITSAISVVLGEELQGYFAV